MNDKYNQQGMALIKTLRTCERGDGLPVELWMTGLGKVLIRAYNEGGYCYTEVPFLDLFEELRNGEITCANEST